MSTKLTIKEAVEIIPVSESSLRRAIKTGEISSEKDRQGRRRIDVSELARVYERLKHHTERPSEYVNNGQVNAIETAKIITLLEAQNTELKEQIASEKIEKNKLLDLADRLQKQNELLMLSPPTKKGWFDLFRLKKA